jgi:DNA-binding NarL/FixJ family response regulator
MSIKNKKIITVAVIEDNADLSSSVREIIDGAEGMRCVATFTSGEKALAKLPALTPNVVLMDINLPGMTGLECVGRLVEVLPKVLVIMVTIHSNLDAIFQSMQAGAVGYLHKPVRAAELIAAIRDVVDGGSPMTAGIARQVVKAFKVMPKLEASSGAILDLTDREHEVLRLLSEGALYKEIAESMGVSWHTVHNHIRHIYEKLHVRSRAQAVNKFLNK